MRAECKALPMKSKNGRWCRDSGKWEEPKLMRGFDCVSNLCCHRDCIQCSRAQIDACPMYLPFHPSLAVSLIYLLCLCAIRNNLMQEEYRPATLLECYTETSNIPVSDRTNLFTQKQCNTTTQHISPLPVKLSRIQNTTKQKSFF